MSSNTSTIPANSTITSNATASNSTHDTLNESANSNISAPAIANNTNGTANATVVAN